MERRASQRTVRRQRRGVGTHHAERVLESNANVLFAVCECHDHQPVQVRAVRRAPARRTSALRFQLRQQDIVDRVQRLDAARGADVEDALMR